MVVCILLPRFELAVAAGGRQALASGPLALAPEIGREPLIGETSAAAEAYGVRAGLRLGEALARCPTLRLVTPDPAGVADAWEHIVAALEGIGAAVESDHPGIAWFEEKGLRTLHGGTVEHVITAARRALAAVTRAATPQSTPITSPLDALSPPEVEILPPGSTPHGPAEADARVVPLTSAPSATAAPLRVPERIGPTSSAASVPVPPGGASPTSSSGAAPMSSSGASPASSSGAAPMSSSGAAAASSRVSRAGSSSPSGAAPSRVLGAGGAGSPSGVTAAPSHVPNQIGAPGGGGPASRGLGSPGGGTGVANVGRIGAAPGGAASSGAGRIGAAPSRFAALAAAHRARTRRPEIAPESPAQLAAYLAPLPVSLLNARPEVAALPDSLERFGIATLGELAALSRAHLADRFGPAGPLARDLAQGKDAPLRPRVPSERLEEVLELPESASGPQLERALGMLIDRVLARPERRGRTVRAVVLSAALVGGGTWRSQMTFREALADPRRMRLAITGRLTELPAPADSLRLRVEAFGPPSGDQRSLLAEPATIRRARLREAVRQTRAAAGPDAALRILAVDPDSRVPERRLALAPWEP
jgi:protein ImuB